jgi:hypothetical protein
MRQVLVLAVIFSLGNTSIAQAGETFLESASRIALRHVRAQSESGLDAKRAPEKYVSAPPSIERRPGGPNRTVQAAQEQAPGLERSAMGKGTKLAIALGILAGVAGIFYAIDRSVEDNTPSSRGER